MIPRYARPLFVPLAIVAALGTLNACKPLRPAGIVAPPRPATASAAWDEDLWIIAKREPSDHLTAESEVPSFPHLQTRSRDGQASAPLPLQRTDVHAAVAGDVAAVTVQQQYMNPFAETIDVEYVFALPENAAISEFVMTIGARHIRGIVRERQEAERLYAEARQAGHVAALLTEERPNVFRQAVANIEPGTAIDVDITYFHTLGYQDGEYELRFPLAAPSQSHPGPRSRSDIALSVDIDAGLPIESVHSPSHAVDIARPTDHSAHVELSGSTSLRDTDFVLRFRVAGAERARELKAGWVGHRDAHGGFFAVTLQPPADPQRTGAPALTEVAVDWGDVQVSDVYPASIPDLVVGRPIVVHGRFRGTGPTTITVSGRTRGSRQRYTIAVSAADLNGSHPALASIWAREHIAALEREGGAHEPQRSAQRITQITDTALEYGLMSAYTTFLVVDAKGAARLPRSGR